jgi:hypothetical protein
LDSLIVAEYPPLFEEFRGRRFNLVWRGSRDGFTAQEFHRRCDGRANTLTLIADTDGNVFGGFTPVKWESRSSGVKGDNSLRSFLFTVRNPHGVSPRKFALRAEKKGSAIWCNGGYGPTFGVGDDYYSEILVCHHCNECRNSWTRIGTRWGDRTYVNDTAFEDFLTCA